MHPRVTGTGRADSKASRTKARENTVSSRRVLIVEDEQMLGANLQEYLRRRGWETQLARSGAHALAEYQRSPPSVVLMDYELPDMDGFQILSAMREQRDCRCVLMTAHTSESVVWRAVEHQITHVLHKPFALSEMEQWLLTACDWGSAAMGNGGLNTPKAGVAPTHPALSFPPSHTNGPTALGGLT
jgi:CheY-like chemotaxis protein